MQTEGRPPRAIAWSCAAGPSASGCQPFSSRRWWSREPACSSWLPTASKVDSTRGWSRRDGRSPWRLRSWPDTRGTPTTPWSWSRASRHEPMRNEQRGGLRTGYAAALRNYLVDPGESELHRAYELGRRAMGDGLGLIELIALHQEAQDEILKERKAPESCVSAVEGSARFLAESLSPFEMTHRSFQDAIAALRRLNEMLEEEARRIAHALHDDAGQLLVSVHLALKDVADGLPPRARDRLMGIRAPLDEIERHLRRLSHELRPTVLDDLGLVPALEFMVQGVSARAGIPIAVEGPKSPRLPALVEVALYRVVQEAVRNATKHAGAKRVDIRVSVQSETVR